jgi:LysR family hydrogen peroxide-inducible transcriptional activator
MHLPTLQQMRYLIALRDSPNFSVAAEKCFVSQPSLSGGIKDMEHVLAHKLVERGHKQHTLTPLGLEMAAEAEIILERATRMAERAKQLSEPMSGVLRLGVIPTIAPYLLPDILPRIQKQYPQLELQLHEDLSGRLIEKLQQGLIDLILLAFPYETPGMVQMPLFEEPFVLACPKGRLSDVEKIKTDDLEPDQLLLLEDGHCLREHALEACGLQTIGRKQEFSATSLATLLQMVASGYGMTLLPDMASTQNFIPKGVKTIPFKNPAPTREIGLAWRRGSERKADFETLGGIIKSVP